MSSSLNPRPLNPEAQSFFPKWKQPFNPPTFHAQTILLDLPPPPALPLPTQDPSNMIISCQDYSIHYNVPALSLELPITHSLGFPVYSSPHQYYNSINSYPSADLVSSFGGMEYYNPKFQPSLAVEAPLPPHLDQPNINIDGSEDLRTVGIGDGSLGGVRISEPKVVNRWVQPPRKYYWSGRCKKKNNHNKMHGFTSQWKLKGSTCTTSSSKEGCDMKPPRSGGRARSINTGNFSGRSCRGGGGVVIPFPSTKEHVLCSGITTVMLKNIPNHFGLDRLMAILDRHCSEENQKAEAHDERRSEYDFIYLPMDYWRHHYESRSANLGYAFVNFTSAIGAFRFYKQYHKHKWEESISHKTCEITSAEVQGIEALRMKFENKVFLSSNPEFRPVEISPPCDGTVGRVFELITIGLYVPGLPTKRIHSRFATRSSLCISV